VIRPRLDTRDWPVPPVSRFAPSPTGYLHLGHVVNAVYVWGVARALGGRVHLRIEDHDRIRSRPEYESALLEDLDWLGFVPDEGRNPIDRQSDRQQVYEDALQRLAREHRVYVCRCSRKQIGSERYDGRCRELALPSAARCGIRVAIEPGMERVDDMLMGALAQDPAEQCGDLLLRDRDGNWTYQLAVVVDDIRQGITLVIRGEDLVSSTGRQVRLARMLGRSEPPRYLHHPLIIGASGDKLSKAARDTGIRELRAQGVTAADVIGRAAAAVGLIRPGTSVHAAAVPDLFL
jgi:glutamyl-tRNA synthetase/glutamyl-Q tRNA(Asp) synthetase